jgi:hypothetical protein
VLLLQRYSTGLQLLDDVLQVFDAACKSIDPSNDERVTRTQETEQGLKLRSTSPVRSARSFGSDDITAGHPQRLFLDGEVLVERGDTRVTVKRHSAPFGSGQPHLGLDLGASPSQKAGNDPIGTPELSHEIVSLGFTLLRQVSSITDCEHVASMSSTDEII